MDGISDGVAKTSVGDKTAGSPPVAQRRQKEQKKNMTDAEINEGLSTNFVNPCPAEKIKFATPISDCQTIR